MASQSALTQIVESDVRKALAECVDDEIALDCLAQWALNPVGRDGGYGIEDNYPLIRENLSNRFNISDTIAWEYVGLLRKYSTKFLISGADISSVRAMALEQLIDLPGEKWRRGILKRLSKSSISTKRLVYLILYLRSRGFDFKNFEASLNEIQALYSTAFEFPFELFGMQEVLMSIGILNRMMITHDNSGKEYVHVITSFLSAESLGLKEGDLKIQADTKQLISHLFDKKKFDQLRFLDEISCENFGLMRSEGGFEDFVPEKRMFGRYGNYTVISPFLLDEIRDDLHARKQMRLGEYESRIENSLLKLISGFDPVGKLEHIHLKGEQILWRIDNGINSKVYVYLTPWMTEHDSEILSSKLDVPKASSLIAIVLNQSPAGSKKVLAEQFGELGELSLICPLSQKEIHIEKLSGASPFTGKIIDSLSKSLNLSIQLSKIDSRSAVKEINEAAPVIAGAVRPKILLGHQGTREVYWAPQLEKNSNIAILGPADSGKTETIKQILLGLRKNNIPFIILDFNRQYVQKESSSPEFGTVIDSNEIAINPLDLESGSSPREQRDRFLEILSSVYEFEDWEIKHIRDAVRSSYQNNGVFEDNPSTWGRKPPTLRNLRTELEVGAQTGKGREWDSIREILQKLDLALAQSLFSQERTNIPFEKLVTGPRIIDLGGLQDDVLKVLACEYLMGKIPYFTKDGSGNAKVFIVIDGAPKAFGKGTSSLRLLREARQRGVGVIYSCRDPINLPELALDNTGAILSFRITDSKSAKNLAEHLGVSDQVLNKNLSEKFTAAVKFSTQPDVSKLTVAPYFQRNQIKA